MSAVNIASKQQVQPSSSGMEWTNIDEERGGKKQETISTQLSGMEQTLSSRVGNFVQSLPPRHPAPAAAAAEEKGNASDIKTLGYEFLDEAGSSLKAIVSHSSKIAQVAQSAISDAVSAAPIAPALPIHCQMVKKIHVYITQEQATTRRSGRDIIERTVDFGIMWTFTMETRDAFKAEKWRIGDVLEIFTRPCRHFFPEYQKYTLGITNQRTKEVVYAEIDKEFPEKFPTVTRIDFINQKIHLSNGHSCHPYSRRWHVENFSMTRVNDKVFIFKSGGHFQLCNHTQQIYFGVCIE